MVEVCSDMVGGVVTWWRCSDMVEVCSVMVEVCSDMVEV